MSKHKTAIDLPEGFSFEWPTYNLVLNVSPFPVYACKNLSETPTLIEDDFIWIKISPHLFGAYEKKLLVSTSCPLCGRPFNGGSYET